MGRSQSRGMPRWPRPWARDLRRVAVAALLLILSLAPASCDLGSGPPEGIIDRETFIATYIDLRQAALTATDGELDDGAREEVLHRHGVTEDDLLEFAEAHGRDVDYLRELWAEVEARMDSLSAREGSEAP